MKFSRLFLNRLHNLPVVHDTVVVIDTLRSFTTAAVALDRGAAAIYPVEGISAAQALARGLARSRTAGAIAGGDPVEGFDFGNSPAQLLTAQLSGERLVLSTAAGVRGLQRFHDARHLFAASLVCARSADLPHDMNALLKAVAPIVSGRGGGTPNLAQGGGPGLDRLYEALVEARSKVDAL